MRTRVTFDTTPYVGTWTGVWKTWVDPDVLHDESAIAMTMDPLLGGTDMLQSYEASIAGGAVEGHALIGPSEGGVTVAWIDSWHTRGIVFTSHGDLDDHGFTVSSLYSAEGAKWRWTTRYTIESDELVIRHFNEGPDLPKYLGVEARLRRTR